MKDNLTEIVFVLDRSGSMYDLVEDTLGGYNSFIESQKQEPGEAILTTVLFDDKYQLLHDRVDIKSVEPLTINDYYARGLTALLDAIGKTIDSIGKKLSQTPEEERPSKVIFVITTDGYENASQIFTYDSIKERVNRQKVEYNWEFIFLGANIDSFGVGDSLGIAYVSNYSSTSDGTKSVYSSLNSTITDYRQTGNVKDSWNDDIK